MKSEIPILIPMLLQHALLMQDGRTLTQWLGRRGQMDCAADLFDDDVRGVLTGVQIDAVRAAAPLSDEQQRVAKAAMLALCGASAASDTVNDRFVRIAAAHAAFGPGSTAQVCDLSVGALAVLREFGVQRVLCLANLTTEPLLVPVPWRVLLGSANVRDLVRSTRLAVHGPSFELGSLEVRWLGN